MDTTRQEEYVRYMLYMAAKNRRYTSVEYHTDFTSLDNVFTITVTMPGELELTPEEASGLDAIRAGVPIEDILA